MLDQFCLPFQFSYPSKFHDVSSYLTRIHLRKGTSFLLNNELLAYRDAIFSYITVILPKDTAPLPPISFREDHTP